MPRSFDAIAASLPSLSDDEQQFFRSLVSDSLCDSLGTRTKAEGVFRDADSWIVLMDPALRAFSEDLKRYSMTRFAWFVQCVRELKQAIEHSDNTLDQITNSRSEVTHLRKDARLVRDDLTHTLLSLAGSDSRAKALVNRASGNLEKGDDALIASVRKLVQQAEEWLSKTDPESQFLVKSKALTVEDVQKAKDTADALAVAIQQAKFSGRVQTNDSPATNRIEGRVLAEMREARNVFELAHERNRLIPRLIPGPATRVTLLGRPAKPAKPKTPVKGPIPAAGAAATGTTPAANKPAVPAPAAQTPAAPATAATRPSQPPATPAAPAPATPPANPPAGGPAKPPPQPPPTP